ncbi:MAG: tryptophan synthase subunit alpha [Alphaproteobacteria bacterium]
MTKDIPASRLTHRFQALRQANRGGLITFITAGDPDIETSSRILTGLAEAGADIIELGMPFSDPMADGPVIQASSRRALRSGMTLRRLLQMVTEFRKQNKDTPLILMGYYNPIYIYGDDAFIRDAKAAGVDGLIIVDLPPEEDTPLRRAATSVGIDWIRLATPTSDEDRLPIVVKDGSGFLYYVSVTGVTGGKSAAVEAVGAAVARLKRHSHLPIAVGFGIATPDQAAAVVRYADAAVVGSALIRKVAENLDVAGKPQSSCIPSVLSLVKDLAAGVSAPLQE